MRKISYSFQLKSGVIANGICQIVLETKTLTSEDVDLIKSVLAQMSKAVDQVERKNIHVLPAFEA